VAKGDANSIAEGAGKIWPQRRTRTQRAFAAASKLWSRSSAFNTCVMCAWDYHEKTLPWPQKEPRRTMRRVQKREQAETERNLRGAQGVQRPMM